MHPIRLDLEGIALNDEKDRLTATFRYRTAAGVVVNLPESTDFTIEWDDMESCALDLKSGELVIRLVEGSTDRHRWLHGSHELRGRWLDRVTLDQAP